MSLPATYLFSGNSLHLSERGLASWAVGARLVVARGLCTYFRLDAKGIPALKRSAFLQLQLPQHAVYAHTGYFASEQGDYVHVWVWNQALVDGAIASQQGGPARWRCVPESACYAYPHQSTQLSVCAGPALAGQARDGSGYEGFVWNAERSGWLGRKGALLDNQWWPQRPSAAQWQAFAQQNRVPSTAGTMASGQATRLRPHMRALASGWVRQGEVAVGARSGMLAVLAGVPWVAAALGAAAVAVCFYAGLLARQWDALEKTQEQLQAKTLSATDSEATKRLETARKAQEVASTANAWALAAARYFASPDVMGLWVYLAAPLSRQSVAIREFDYRAGELRFLLVAPRGNMDLPAVLGVFEASAQLTDIGIEPTQDLTQLRMKARFRKPAILLERASERAP